MSLQLALTQLESLAELLNERKRETEQYQAFRDTLRRVSGKFSLRPLADNNRYLLRQDNAHLVVIYYFYLFVFLADCKSFFLRAGIQPKWDDLQDQRASPVVAQRPAGVRHGRLQIRRRLPQLFREAHAQVGISNHRRRGQLILSVAHLLSGHCISGCVQVEDTSTSPTLSRLLSSGSNLRSSEAISGVDNLCQEMNQLMHDYEVITRIDSLISSLHGQYEVITMSLTL